MNLDTLLKPKANNNLTIKEKEKWRKRTMIIYISKEQNTILWYTKTSSIDSNFLIIV